MKPGSGEGPVAFDGGRRDVQTLGNFLETKTAEKTEFHYAASLGVVRLKLGERLIQGKRVEDRRSRSFGIGERNTKPRAAAFGGAAFACVKDQYLAHHQRRHA